MKGVSPLIAGVLMITFTISAGIILSNWIVPFFRGQTDDVTAKGNDAIACTNGKLFFEKSGFTANGTHVTLMADNQGTRNLTDIRLYITLDNGTLVTISDAINHNATLEPGRQQLLVKTAAINKTNVTKVSISTGPNDKCPSIQWETTYP